VRRWNKRKKTNSGHNVRMAANAPTDAPTDSSSSKVKQARKLKVVGKKVFADDSKIKASGLEIDKAVFCVSNLSLAITDDDLI